MSEETDPFVQTENPIITFPSGDGDIKDNEQDNGSGSYTLPPSKFNSIPLTDDSDPNDTNEDDQIHPDVKLRLITLIYFAYEFI